VVKTNIKSLHKGTFFWDF